MAKPTWVVASPMTGSGNGTINFSTASPHTGRVARTGTATVEATGVETPVTVNITQSPKTEFVTYSQSSYASSKEGGALTITGTSNSAKLNFSFAADGSNPITGIDVPAAYKANGVTTNNNTDIEGDPGASAEYEFEIQLTVPENETITERTKTLVVTTTGGQTAQVTITQAAGSPFIWVTEEGTTTASITIPQDGTAQSIQILSNAPWRVL